MILLVAALSSALLVAVVRAWAIRKAILDHPNERSSHTRPTPRGGGIAIVVVTLTGLSIEYVRLGGWTSRRFSLFIGTTIVIAAVSWFDDLRGLSSIVRLFVHIGCAMAMLLAFGPWPTQPAVAFLSVLPALIWIVGLTNAYNFMDGIDGIAGAQALVAGLAWGWLGYATRQPLIGILGLLVAGSAAGFLAFNWQPARIFMGDVGSAFLGFVFAVMAIAASQQDRRLLLCGVLVVWPFIFDSAITFLRRARKHEPLLSAHRSHLYQRLTQSGLSHATVALLYAILALVGAACSVAIVVRVGHAQELALAIVAILAVGLWSFVSRRERLRAP